MVITKYVFSIYYISSYGKNHYYLSAVSLAEILAELKATGLESPSLKRDNGFKSGSQQSAGNVSTESNRKPYSQN